MWRSHKNYIALLVMFLLFSCEKELDLKKDSETNLFVIEALLTNELKQHTLKLSNSISGPVENATANIVNLDLSDTIWFAHEGNGNYLTPTLALQVATNYQFNCYYDGKHYSYKTKTIDNYSIETVNLESSPTLDSTYFAYSELSGAFNFSDFTLFAKIYEGEEMLDTEGEVIDTLWGKYNSIFQNGADGFFFHVFQNGTLERFKTFDNYSNKLYLKGTPGQIMKIEGYAIENKTAQYIIYSAGSYQASFGDLFQVATPKPPENLFQITETVGSAIMTIKVENIFTIP